MVARGAFATAAVIFAAVASTMFGSGSAFSLVAEVGPAAQTGVGPSVPTPTVVVPAAPVPIPVLTTCGWLVKGYASNCDGLDPDQLFTNAAWPTACTSNNDLLMRTVESTTMSDGSVILLTYSGGAHSGCRTAAASLYVPRYSGSGSCNLTITRSSDGATLTSRIEHYGGFWSAETASFYDAGVSSYASATCTYGGHTFTGHTSAY